MLRLLLVVSVILIITGVVRCSVEITRPRADGGGTEQAEQGRDGI
jgi:hypothetical protein